MVIPDNYCDCVSDPTFGVLGGECLEIIKKKPRACNFIAKETLAQAFSY